MLIKFPYQVQLDATFQWLPVGGRSPMKPANMTTHHLFNVMRMIWNHSMPKKFEPFTQHRFGTFYTAEYMQRAVMVIGRELVRRTDLTLEMCMTLQEMADYLQTNPQLISDTPTVL